MKDDAFKAVASKFLSGNTIDVVDIITFVQEPWGLKFTLKPVQCFILKCYYGLELNDKDRTIDVPDVVNDRIMYTFTELEFLHWLFEEGRSNTQELVPGGFRELTLVAGRRSGKSSLAACISNYEMYKLIKRGDPSKFYNFPPETDICITNVAPTDDQAGQLFNMIMGMALNCSFFRDRMVNQTQTYFNLMTNANMDSVSKKKRASIISRAGGCSSNALRGGNNLVVVLDEFAFFIDNGGRFSGEEVYRALTPSTLSFKKDGKIVCLSSPYAKYGAFWDQYNRSFENKETMLMFQMYTSMVNPDIDSSILKSERRKNRIRFICEIGGEFSEKVTAWIDDEEKFKLNVDFNVKTARKGSLAFEYFAGIDLGVKTDGTAIAIVHNDRDKKKIVLDYLDVWYSGSSDIWDSSLSIYKGCTRFAGIDMIQVTDVVKELQELCKWYPIKSGWFDQWNGYALYEQLQRAGLKQFRMEHVSESLNSEIYQIIKTLYTENELDLYAHPVLVPELLSLEAEAVSKNKIIVGAQNKPGAHDDASDAFARAVYDAFNANVERPRNVASLVGPGNVVLSGASGGPITQIAYRAQKLRAHGDYPRLGSGLAQRKTQGFLNRR